MNSVLITGSAGFIGTHLAEHYLHSGFSVIGLDNYITGTLQNTTYLSAKYKTQFQFIEHDASETWQPIACQVSEQLAKQSSASALKYVFHLASPASVKNYQKYMLETLKVNSVGLQSAISFADTHSARLIFASTSEIYGSPLASPQKESDWGNVNSFGERSCYDEAKRFGEALIYSSNKINSTQHGLVRIFNTYGPRMNENDDRVPNTFVANALKNHDLVVYGSGQQTRSFCYIDDLVAGLISYAKSDIKSPINLGSENEITILELANLVIKITNSKSKIVFKELPQDDPPKRRPDLTLARKQLDYTNHVSLEAGLIKMTDWQKTK